MVIRIKDKSGKLLRETLVNSFNHYEMFLADQKRKNFNLEIVRENKSAEVAASVK